jgi:hypothetical protein
MYFTNQLTDFWANLYICMHICIHVYEHYIYNLIPSAQFTVSYLIKR